MNPILPIVLFLVAPPTSAAVVQDDGPRVRPMADVSIIEVVSSEAPERDRTEPQSAIDRRVRDILNDANARYWKNRARTKTLPLDRWTPQQAGWMDASGRPLVINWPWWAW
tara:strand:- start:1264 stop:1596 length:333 start_codon:yes stop_codon:yes gene_type:complete